MVTDKPTRDEIVSAFQAARDKASEQGREDLRALLDVACAAVDYLDWGEPQLAEPDNGRPVCPRCGGRAWARSSDGQRWVCVPESGCGRTFGLNTRRLNRRYTDDDVARWVKLAQAGYSMAHIARLAQADYTTVNRRVKLFFNNA